MKIISVDVYRYSLDLIRPLILQDQEFVNRQGLVLQLISDEGKEGFGEIAPLPGFSHETLDDACDQMMSFGFQLYDRDIPDSIKNLNGEFDKWLKNPDLKPSVRFGIESAVLGLLSNAQKVSPVHLISPEPHTKVRVSGLLSGAHEEIAAQTKELLAAGFTELKLKVGGDPAEAIEKVNIVNNIAYGKALLHLDVNRAWDFDTALDFGKKIGCAAVNYIEEPFKDIRRIPEFFDETLIPVALDESIQYLTVEDIRGISGVDILILKPTILGGIEKTKKIIDQARDSALSTTISSSFESSLGISMLASLAGVSPHQSTTGGFDTLKWFKDDILNTPVQSKNGEIIIDEKGISSSEINFNLLEKVK